jgi:tetratricopeptide (TPR) repeat protein
MCKQSPKQFPKTCRSILLLTAVFSAAASAALSDPLQDCTQDRRARLRLQSCPAVVSSPLYNDFYKSTAYTNLGEIRLQAGALKEAIGDFTHAIRLSDSNGRAYAGRAQARFSSGDVKGSIRDFDKAIAITPTESTYFVSRGHAYLVTGNPDASIRDLTEALRLDPRSANALNNRGLAYRKKGDLQNALADYNAAIEINPAYALAYANRGHLFESQGKKREAIEDFTTALRLDPSQIETRRILKRLGTADVAERESDARVRRGRVLVETNCAQCHALGAKGTSPNPDAPPFHDLRKRYQMLSLRAPITRGIAAPHDTMPSFRPSEEDLDAIVAYINSLPVNKLPLAR